MKKILSKIIIIVLILFILAYGFYVYWINTEHSKSNFETKKVQVSNDTNIVNDDFIEVEHYNDVEERYNNDNQSKSSTTEENQTNTNQSEDRQNKYNTTEVNQTENNQTQSVTSNNSENDKVSNNLKQTESADNANTTENEEVMEAINIAKATETMENSEIISTKLNLYAISALLMDASNDRVLYEKNGTKKMPMASTTKIMTLIVTLENADLNDIVTVSKYASTMPDVQLGIREGEQYKLGDLVYSLMLESHNDDCVILGLS